MVHTTNTDNPIDFPKVAPRCYQLIGVPGSGKSTWVSNQHWGKYCVVASTDEYVETFAISVGKTYSEVFAGYMPTAVNLMTEKVIAARKAGKDIIWDQTSTTVKSREKKFRMLPGYEHIAVVFLTPERQELVRRLNSRPGKEIPEHVVASMIANFQEPTKEEGFTEIIRVM